MVSITPSLDEDHQPWQVELMMSRPGASHLDVLDRSLASAKGKWTQSGVTPGAYVLTIQQQDGSEWSSQELAFRPEDGDLPIDIVLEAVRVAGSVTLRDRPVAATVRFGGEHGPAFLADRQGRFTGTIYRDERAFLPDPRSSPLGVRTFHPDQRSRHMKRSRETSVGQKLTSRSNIL
jgi:hypothetical protein